MDKSLVKTKHTKKAIFWTTVYLVFWRLPLSVIIVFVDYLSGPHVSSFFAITILYSAFLVPLSIPVAIFLIWFNYFRSKYERIPLLCAMPVIVGTIVYLFTYILFALLDMSYLFYK